MTRVALIGYDPGAVDFSDPALPPGLNAQKIAAGIAIALEQMKARGWQADFLSIKPDDTAAAAVRRALAAGSYDCVVIGGGIRLASNGLTIFEAVVNAVREAAPNAPIAFNTRPEDSAEAAARWL